jgi:hypothetical protein
MYASFPTYVPKDKQWWVGEKYDGFRCFWFNDQHMLYPIFPTNQTKSEHHSTKYSKLTSYNFPQERVPFPCETNSYLSYFLSGVTDTVVEERSSQSCPKSIPFFLNLMSMAKSGIQHLPYPSLRLSLTAVNFSCRFGRGNFVLTYQITGNRSVPLGHLRYCV